MKILLTKENSYTIRSSRCILMVFSLLWSFCSCQNTSTDNHPEYFDTILYRVDTTRNERKEQAIAFLDSAYRAFPNPGNIDKIGVYVRKKNFYYLLKKDYSKAILYLDTLLMLDQNNSNFLMGKGDALFAIKNYEEGFHYYILAKQNLQRNQKNICDLPDYSGHIASLFYKQGKYRLAAAYYLECCHEYAECGKKDFATFASLQTNLDNVGECYNNLDMPDSASFYFDSTLSLLNKRKHEFADTMFVELAKAVVYGNQAWVLDKKGQFDAAKKKYMQSIDGTKTADRGYTQSTQIRLADMQLRSNQLQEAEETLNNVKSSIDTLPNEPLMATWYKLKTSYYDKKKDFVFAYQYQKKYISIKDSIEARDRQFASMDVGREFESREEKAINEDLKKDNKLKTIYLTAAIIVSAMAICMILLIWQTLRRSTKHILQLQKLNTQVQQKNDDLQKTLISLEQSHQENNRIVRIVAHDLKNPISAINNLIYSLLRKDYPEDLKEIFELIKTACGNSMALIKDVLNDKKHPSVIRKELVDMKRLLEYCVDLLQAKADEKKQQLTLQAENAVVMLNRQKMWRVVSNILNNAIKFSHEHAIIDIKLQRKENSVILSVHDKGIGIPANLQDQIFTLSPEASRPGTFGEESYGLGLSISRKIIEEHDGKIWFDSTDGKGSVFYVELPFLN